MIQHAEEKEQIIGGHATQTHVSLARVRLGDTCPGCGLKFTDSEAERALLLLEKEIKSAHQPCEGAECAVSVKTLLHQVMSSQDSGFPLSWTSMVNLKFLQSSGSVLQLTESSGSVFREGFSIWTQMSSWTLIKQSVLCPDWGGEPLS